ncbi:glycoside hydrolase family 11 protein [Ruminococcus flavefaciens]|uniref:glycoside hydrolase family 11 protein n=1 Tax=Ruminococcus flavefaciens TaxID=1265 RepID=UPI0002E4A0F0|nr:glycoside hydrolase family 11 protein [Ruminococcus flavefaciens]
MSRQRKKFISAAIAAAICTASVSVPSSNAGIVIDHDSNGIDKGYYYEYSNCDEKSKPVLDIEGNGCFDCKWDNEKDFSAVRGVKFSSPVEYSKLGDMMIRYWRRIEVEKMYNGDGYLKFGIRLHNKNGNTITILETDENASPSASIRNNESYKKVGTLASFEIMNDYTVFGIDDSDKKDVNYTIYSYEDNNGTSFICRRDTPVPTNNYTDNSRKISISDKLGAVAETGFDIGEITDITWFVEASSSKGEANIHNNGLMIENMPELLPDQCDDEQAPLRISSFDSGVRNGYYYYMNCYDNSDMEVVSPSLFKSEWDNSANTYEVSSVFERGKTFDSGQSYKAAAGSGIDYSMDFDAQGRFSVCTYAEIAGPETEEARFNSELYIVDACSKEWAVPQSGIKAGRITADGCDYDVFYCLSGAQGSFKTIFTFVYYFVNVNAIKNSEKGTISVKHELAPFVDYIHDQGAVLGSPGKLTAQFNCGISKGKAELTRNVVTLSDFIAEDDEFREAYEKYDPMNEPYSSALNKNDLYGKTVGSNSTMYKYAVDKTKCDWISKYDLNLSPFKFKQFSFSRYFLQDDSNSWGYDGDGSIIVDYSIDMGELSAKDDESRWIIGSSIECNNRNFFNGSVPEGEFNGTTIVVADKWEGDPLFFFGNPYGYIADKEEPDMILKNISPPLPYHDFEKLGTIESGGAEYDVAAAFPYNSCDYAYIIVTRKQALNDIKDEDVFNGYKRYANTVNASDIVNKIRALGYDAGLISEASASVISYHNEGSALVNSYDVKIVPNEKNAYTADDVRKLSDFLLGKKTDIPQETDYDLNGDGVWDSFDLIALKRNLSQND